GGGEEASAGGRGGGDAQVRQGEEKEAGEDRGDRGKGCEDRPDEARGDGQRGGRRIAESAGPFRRLEEIGPVVVPLVERPGPQRLARAEPLGRERRGPLGGGIEDLSR